MKHIIIFFLFIICACEVPYECGFPNFYAGGLCVYSEVSVDSDEISKVVETLELEVRAKGYNSVYDLEGHLKANNTNLEFVNSDISIGCEHYKRDVYACDQHIGGVNYDGADIYVRHTECLGQSALAHEVLHSIEKFYLDIYDPSHMTPWFFEEYSEGDNDIWWDTIEVRMWRRMTCELDSCIDYRPGWGCDSLDPIDADWSVPFSDPDSDDKEPTETIEIPNWK